MAHALQTRLVMRKASILGAIMMMMGCANAESPEGPAGEQPVVVDESSVETAAVAGRPRPSVSCDTRIRGALITFNVGDQVLTVWSTNAKFNQKAFLAAVQGSYVTPVFNDLVEGADCDGQWTWHPDPSNTIFDEGYSASCDGLPSEIEADKTHWLGAVDRYCPSKVLISAYKGL